MRNLGVSLCAIALAMYMQRSSAQLTGSSQTDVFGRSVRISGFAEVNAAMAPQWQCLKHPLLKNQNPNDQLYNRCVANMHSYDHTRGVTYSDQMNICKERLNSAAGVSFLNQPESTQKSRCESASYQSGYGNLETDRNNDCVYIDATINPSPPPEEFKGGAPCQVKSDKVPVQMSKVTITAEAVKKNNWQNDFYTMVMNQDRTTPPQVHSCSNTDQIECYDENLDHYVLHNVRTAAPSGIAAHPLRSRDSVTGTLKIDSEALQHTMGDIGTNLYGNNYTVSYDDTYDTFMCVKEELDILNMKSHVSVVLAKMFPTTNGKFMYRCCATDMTDDECKADSDTTPNNWNRGLVAAVSVSGLKSCTRTGVSLGSRKVPIINAMWTSVHDYENTARATHVKLVQNMLLPTKIYNGANIVHRTVFDSNTRKALNAGYVRCTLSPGDQVSLTQMVSKYEIINIHYERDDATPPNIKGVTNIENSAAMFTTITDDSMKTVKSLLESKTSSTHSTQVYSMVSETVKISPGSRKTVYDHILTVNGGGSPVIYTSWGSQTSSSASCTEYKYLPTNSDVTTTWDPETMYNDQQHRVGFVGYVDLTMTEETRGHALSITNAIADVNVNEHIGTEGTTCQRSDYVVYHSVLKSGNSNCLAQFVDKQTVLSTKNGEDVAQVTEIVRLLIFHKGNSAAICTNKDVMISGAYDSGQFGGLLSLNGLASVQKLHMSYPPTVKTTNELQTHVANLPTDHIFISTDTGTAVIELQLGHIMKAQLKASMSVDSQNTLKVTQNSVLWCPVGVDDKPALSIDHRRTQDFGLLDAGGIVAKATQFKDAMTSSCAFHWAFLTTTASIDELGSRAAKPETIDITQNVVGYCVKSFLGQTTTGSTRGGREDQTTTRTGISSADNAACVADMFPTVCNSANEENCCDHVVILHLDDVANPSTRTAFESSNHVGGGSCQTKWNQVLNKAKYIWAGAPDSTIPIVNVLSGTSAVTTPSAVLAALSVIKPMKPFTDADMPTTAFLATIDYTGEDPGMTDEIMTNANGNMVQLIAGSSQYRGETHTHKTILGVRVPNAKAGIITFKKITTYTYQSQNLDGVTVRRTLLSTSSTDSAATQASEPVKTDLPVTFTAHGDYAACSSDITVSSTDNHVTHTCNVNRPGDDDGNDTTKMTITIVLASIAVFMLLVVGSLMIFSHQGITAIRKMLTLPARGTMHQDGMTRMGAGEVGTHVQLSEVKVDESGNGKNPRMFGFM